ncbi:MAG TPA: hypothetical protein ENI56_00075 [Candidatus Kaiserbacteria bacterium]|nr:hypothetical protein [Candidatus Kaiserbacteria bacterium]
MQARPIYLYKNGKSRAFARDNKTCYYLKSMVQMTKNTAKETPNEESDSDHLELRVYELGFHIDPDLPKQKIKELFQSIKNNIADAGTVITIGEPHRLRLAYTISRMERTGRHDFSSAFFGWVVYQSDGEAHARIIDMIKEHNDVFRYIDVRTTKEAAEHAAIQYEEWYRHTQKQDMQEEEKTEEVHVRVQESKEKLDVAIENAIL